MDIDTEPISPPNLRTTSRPLFRVCTHEGDTFKYDETELRALSPLIDAKLHDGTYEENGIHYVPWMPSVAATFIEKYVKGCCIDLTKETSGGDVLSYLRATKWLGLENLTLKIFKFVLRDCEDKTPRLFDSCFMAAAVLARYVHTDECRDIHDKVINMAINQLDVSRAKRYVKVSTESEVLKKRLGDRGQATIWQILARVMANAMDGTAGQPDSNTLNPSDADPSSVV
ncbi:hypothetical protein TWF281_003737 [Arthrobotrys megalospora]